MRTLVVAILALLSVLALGDGMYVPPGTISGTPSIPDQRAILFWDDGIETLFIESTLRGQAADYSWIVPLPSTPSLIDRARPSTMPLTFNALRPKYARALPYSEVPALATALVGLALASLAVMGSQERSARMKRLLTSSALTLVGAFLVTIVGGVPGEMSKGAGMAGAPDSPQPVVVEFQKEVGSYQVSILSSRSADELIQWLKRAGTELPARARPIVASYLTEGWCFMVARIRKESGVDLKPHPLRAVFASSVPIYPMRLTALATPELDLEMMVAGPGVAANRLMKYWRSETLGSGRGNGGGILVHPDVEPFYPGNATLTRLRGRISAADMAQDIRFRWTKRPLSEPELITRRRLVSEGILYGVAASLLIGWTISYFSAIYRWPMRATAVSVFWGGLACGLITGWYTATGPTDATVDPNPNRRIRSDGLRVHLITQAVGAAQKTTGRPFPERFERELAEIRGRNSGVRTLVEARPIDYEIVRKWKYDDLGGYTLETVAPNQYKVRILDWNGTSLEYDVVDSGVGQPPSVWVDFSIVLTPPELARVASRVVPMGRELRIKVIGANGIAIRPRWISDGKFKVRLKPGSYRVQRVEPGFGIPALIGTMNVTEKEQQSITVKWDISPLFAPR